jgi:hypothetical protein
MQHISKHQRILMQALVEMGRTTLDDWRKESKRMRISNCVFYNNRNMFLERNLIGIDGAIVYPKLENVKTYFGKQINFN